MYLDFQVWKKFASATEVHQEKSCKLYDLTQYEFPYTSEETETILDVLNKSDQEDLSEFRIAKSKAKKLMESRTRVGSFCSLSDLLNIEGFGLKSVEGICERILLDRLSDSEKESELQLKAQSHKSRLVKPKVLPAVLEVSSFVCFIGIV